MNLERSVRLVDPTLSFVDRRLAKLAALWLERATDGVPERAAFGPEVLHGLGLLPYVILVDVVPSVDGGVGGGGERFRYRLIGTEITAAVGRDVTGRYLDELYPPAIYEKRAEPLRWVLRERRPLRATDRLDMPGKEHLCYEALCAPVVNGGSVITVIMIAVVRFRPDPPGDA